jgi:Bax protein
MKKSRNKKNSNRPHISYKYIAAFCVTFAMFNFFVEKIASKNEGKNNPQIQNIRFNQVQSYKPNIEIQKFSKKISKNNVKTSSVQNRKSEFIADLLPIVRSANQDIIEKRGILFEIIKKVESNNLNVLEAAILKKLFNEYKVKNNDLAELKKRIDIVPISLAIAQAAIESGWGTSRFAQEGNAYFGQKVIGVKANGIKPSESENPLIKVRIFKNLNDSVEAYLNNLNTHFAYKNFRKSRKELRSFGKTLEGRILANQLKKYSELGNEYINNVQKIIKKNNLSKFDFIEYRSAQR